MFHKRVLSILEYIFYKYYKWSQKINSETDSHEIMASFMISLVMILNVFAIFALVEYITGNKILLFIEKFKYYGALVSVLIMYMIQLFFCHKRRYLKILEKFNYENALHKKKGNIAVSVYTIASPIVLMVLWVIIARSS